MVSGALSPLLYPRLAPENAACGIFKKEGSMKVIQMVSAGCNRECFVLTEDGRVFLLRYSSGDNYKWLEMPSISLAEYS